MNITPEEMERRVEYFNARFDELPRNADGSCQIRICCADFFNPRNMAFFMSNIANYCRSHMLEIDFAAVDPACDDGFTMMLNLKSSQSRNQNEDAGQNPDISSEKRESYGPLTFQQYLRTLESSPWLLEAECREAKRPHEIHQIKAALLLWKERGFPNQEEPPEWKCRLFSSVLEWAIKINS